MSTNSLVHIIEGNWGDIKGKIKRRWGKLTDDDLEQVNGSYEELTGKLEEVYGYSQDEIEDKLKIFAEKLDLKEMGENIQEKITESFTKVWDIFKNKKDDLQDGIYCYVKGNPVQSASIASVALAVVSYVAFKCLRK